MAIDFARTFTAGIEGVVSGIAEPSNGSVVVEIAGLAIGSIFQLASPAIAPNVADGLIDASLVLLNHRIDKSKSTSINCGFGTVLENPAQAAMERSTLAINASINNQLQESCPDSTVKRLAPIKTTR